MNKISLQYSRERFTKDERALIERAFDYALEAHKDQVRSSGEPYIIHPIAVAETVDSWKLDCEAMQAALLHDVVEDTGISEKDIESLFGETVARLVAGVTKLDLSSMPGMQPDSARAEVSAENLRKLLLATSADPRVMIIKLADRLHNLRTLEHLDSTRQAKIARESLEIFAPLADRLGMGRVKADIEDLAFKYAKPNEYMYIAHEMKDIVQESEHYLKMLRDTMSRFLAEGGIEVKLIEGRQKHLYSVYKKTLKTGSDLSKMYDLLAIRVIVDTEADCYHTLGLIHQRYKPLIYRIKDYIAVPKPNGYRSLHTTVFAIDGRITEMQIRTPEMHEEAEHGLAAHFYYDAFKKTAAYREGKNASALPDKMKWIKQIAKVEQASDTGAEFAEKAKSDILTDSIFVFSPKGDLYELPERSTPVDFAFAIHTDVGLRTLGAKVNGRIANLDSVLENRDVVEIMTRREPAPNRDWLNFVRTSSAKMKIRSWFRGLSRESNITSGKTVLESELRAWHKGKVEDIPSANMASALSAMGMKSADDLFAALGEGAMAPVQVMRRIFPDAFKQSTARTVKRTESTGRVAVEGKKLPYNLAPCCHPVFPQPLVGYVTRGEGVTVHVLGCRNLPVETERLVTCRWEMSDESTEMLVCDIKVIAHNRLGLLSDVTGAVARQGRHIGHISSRPEEGSTGTVISFAVEVPDMFELAKIMRLIERVHGVVSVERV